MPVSHLSLMQVRSQGWTHQLVSEFAAAIQAVVLACQSLVQQPVSLQEPARLGRLLWRLCKEMLVSPESERRVLQQPGWMARVPGQSPSAKGSPWEHGLAP